MSKIYNHYSPKVSEREAKMIACIPEGGNWQNISPSIPSKRLEQIRKSGGRTTYYGRLKYNSPSYTITTYFNRIGNGCNIHPEQDRIISIREAARLQSFRDSFEFLGPKGSQYKQIGNAVPPLLARAVAEHIQNHVKSNRFIDLFAGAGGLSEGFVMQGFELVGANEINKYYHQTFLKNHKLADSENIILGDVEDKTIKNKIIDFGKKESVGVIIGGPPCQGFSLAGWRNPKDKRNKLFKSFVDIVREVKPEFFLLENVPGILSMRNGDAVKEIIFCFEELGYFVNSPLKLSAEEFGVPQKRKRVFIIGSKKKIELGEIKKMFSNTDSSLPVPITVKEAIYGLPEISPNEEFGSETELVPFSSYQKLLMGLINFKEFYTLIKKGIR